MRETAPEAPPAAPEPAPSTSKKNTILALAAAVGAVLTIFAVRKFQARTAGEAKYGQLVAEVAAAEGIPASALAAVVRNESGWNNDKPVDSRCGPNVNCTSRFEPRINECSIGLAHVLVSTARSVGITGNMCDPRTGLTAGARYLKKLYDDPRTGGDWEKVFIAYNAGPGRIENPPSRTAAYADRAVSQSQQYKNSGLSGRPSMFRVRRA